MRDGEEASRRISRTAMSGGMYSRLEGKVKDLLEKIEKDGMSH